MNPTKERRAAVMVALAGISWSFAGSLGKLSPWSAFSLVAFRGLIAVIMLGLIRRSFRPSKGNGNWIGAIGVLGTCILFMYANKLTSSANAIVLQYAMTVIVIAEQALLFHTRPRRMDILAATLVIVGVVLCFCQNLGKGALLGDVLALASAATYSFVFLAARFPGTNPLSYAYQGNLLCCLFLFVLPMDPGVSTGGLTGWLIAGAMGICLGMGYFCFSEGMKTGLSPTTASIVSNIEPVLNPLWVLLFIGDSPGILSLSGAAVVLVTVTVYSLAKGN